MAGDPAAATWQGSLFAETVTEAEEEMVGAMEVAELVAGVEVEPFSDMGLEGYDLIEAGEIGTFVDDVVTYSELDGEYRHHEFGSD